MHFFLNRILILQAAEQKVTGTFLFYFHSKQFIMRMEFIPRVNRLKPTINNIMLMALARIIIFLRMALGGGFILCGA